MPAWPLKSSFIFMSDLFANPAPCTDIFVGSLLAFSLVFKILDAQPISGLLICVQEQIQHIHIYTYWYSEFNIYSTSRDTNTDCETSHM